MNKIDDDKVKALIHSIGLKYNLPDSTINHIVNSPYKFTREVITNLNFEGIETEEDFNKLELNFIYRYIGKLYTNFSIFDKFKQQSLTQKDNLNKRWKNKE